MEEIYLNLRGFSKSIEDNANITGDGYLHISCDPPQVSFRGRWIRACEIEFKVRQVLLEIIEKEQNEGFDITGVELILENVDNFNPKITDIIIKKPKINLKKEVYYRIPNFGIF